MTPIRPNFLLATIAVTAGMACGSGEPPPDKDPKRETETVPAPAPATAARAPEDPNLFAEISGIAGVLYPPSRGDSVYWTEEVNLLEAKLWVKPKKGGAARVLADVGSSAAADEEYVYWTGHDNDPGLWRLPLAGGTSEQISDVRFRGGLGSPEFIFAGDWIVGVVATYGNAIYRVPRSGGEAKRLVEAKRPWVFSSARVDGDTLYIAQQRPPELYAVSISKGGKRRVAPLPERYFDVYPPPWVYKGMLYSADQPSGPSSRALVRTEIGGDGNYQSLFPKLQWRELRIAGDTIYGYASSSEPYYQLDSFTCTKLVMPDGSPQPASPRDCEPNADGDGFVYEWSSALTGGAGGVVRRKVR